MIQDDQSFNDLSEGHFSSYYNAVVVLAIEAGFNPKFIEYYKLDIKDYYYDGFTPQECFDKEFYNGEDFELKSVLY